MAQRIQKKTTLTSKGQITVPREIRRVLGLRTGDKLLFEADAKEVRVRAVRSRTMFSKYRGIGNEGIGSGRKSIEKWLRGLRDE